MFPPLVSSRVKEQNILFRFQTWVKGTEDQDKADKQWISSLSWKISGPRKQLRKVRKNIYVEEIFNKHIKPKKIILSLSKAMQDSLTHAYKAKATPEKQSTSWTYQMKSYFSARVCKVKIQVKIAWWSETLIKPSITLSEHLWISLKARSY